MFARELFHHLFDLLSGFCFLDTSTIPTPIESDECLYERLCIIRHVKTACDFGFDKNVFKEGNNEFGVYLLCVYSLGCGIGLLGLTELPLKGLIEPKLKLLEFMCGIGVLRSKRGGASRLRFIRVQNTKQFAKGEIVRF